LFLSDFKLQQIPCKCKVGQDVGIIIRNGRVQIQVARARNLRFLPPSGTFKALILYFEDDRAISEEFISVAQLEYRASLARGHSLNWSGWPGLEKKQAPGEAISHDAVSIDARRMLLRCPSAHQPYTNSLFPHQDTTWIHAMDPGTKIASLFASTRLIGRMVPLQNCRAKLSCSMRLVSRASTTLLTF
jgi:hypothetical protein